MPESTFNTILSICATVPLMAILIAVSGTRNKWNSRSLSYGAISMALSFTLSFIKIYHMLTGGSVTLASMLPIMLYSVAFGPECGLCVGGVYGLLQYLQGGYFAHPVQFLLDYPLAFSMLGLAGIRFFRNGNSRQQMFGMVLSMLLAAVGRGLCAVLAGCFYWNASILESLSYNCIYLIPDIAICIAVAIPTAPRLVRMMRTGDLK